MKKIALLLILSLSVLSFASCGEQTGDSSSASANVSSSTGAASSQGVLSDIVTEESSQPKASSAAVSSEKTETFANSGYCAVGVVDSKAKTAKVLSQGGAVATVGYDGTAPTAGGVYSYQKSGSKYKFEEVAYVNGSALKDPNWEVAVYDNTHAGNPDIIYTNDGTNETFYDFTKDSVIFARYSETEWRIFKGDDLILSSGFPVYGWFACKQSAAGGNAQVTVLLIGRIDAATGKIMKADAGSTVYMDAEGFGWNNGDKIIK